LKNTRPAVVVWYVAASPLAGVLMSFGFRQVISACSDSSPLSYARSIWWMWR
jgi:hypothetical protein